MPYGKPGTDFKALSFAQQQEWDTPATPRFRKDASFCRLRKRILDNQERHVGPDSIALETDWLLKVTYAGTAGVATVANQTLPDPGV